MVRHLCLCMSVLSSSYKNLITRTGPPPSLHLIYKDPVSRQSYCLRVRVKSLLLTVNLTMERESPVTSGHVFCNKRGNSSCMCTLAWSMGAMLFVLSLWTGIGNANSSLHLVPSGKVIDSFILAGEESSGAPESLEVSFPRSRP